MADSSNQGSSGVLNERIQGNDRKSMRFWCIEIDEKFLLKQ